MGGSSCSSSSAAQQRSAGPFSQGLRKLPLQAKVTWQGLRHREGHPDSRLLSFLSQHLQLVTLVQWLLQHRGQALAVWSSRAVLRHISM